MRRARGRATVWTVGDFLRELHRADHVDRMLPRMDLTKYQHRDSVTVNAAPEAVYAVVADITRIGELSPVCKRAQWTDDDHTRFTGDNETPERQWTTHCRVDVAEPGKEFSFINCGMDG